MFEVLVLIAQMSLPADAGVPASGPTCHANQQMFEQGDTACLAIPAAPKRARCGMVLNNSAWITVEENCVVMDQAPERQSLPPPEK